MFDKFYLNARKPKGLGGKLILARMNKFEHARLAEWGLDHLAQNLNTAEKRMVMDVGCGGGANIERLLTRCPSATVFGLDYSPVSVEKSLKHNKAAVKAERCIVRQGDVTDLPFGDNEFDLITAFETVYFWKPIQTAFSEVFRVLKPGGAFFICNASGAKPWSPDSRSELLDMTVYDKAALKNLLSSAGFKKVDVHTATESGWICAIAIK